MVLKREISCNLLSLRDFSLCPIFFYICRFSNNEDKLKASLFGVWDSADLNMKEKNDVLLYCNVSHMLCYPHGKDQIGVLE